MCRVIVLLHENDDDDDYDAVIFAQFWPVRVKYQSSHRAHEDMVKITKAI